ncbi:MAG: hypothetical protein GEV28_24000 [Actinophytocola sp.]|uniref:hypothetical protein n=1 Tax=Actinophytocola sp. TaxID=1872138 RepID=UPI0013265DF1|nr:hypothetical protein [Actinophytocola sp.]MPZ83287.1 hypothetical protein [Actinophytocola sp.]
MDRFPDRGLRYLLADIAYQAGCDMEVIWRNWIAAAGSVVDIVVVHIACDYGQKRTFSDVRTLLEWAASMVAILDSAATCLNRRNRIWLSAVRDRNGNEQNFTYSGEPARGYGGTADVVDAARDRGLPVTVIWPEGATRD